MKHLLPILTLALLGAAVTAFADVADATATAAAYRGFYYDYYLRANITFDPETGSAKPPFVTQAHDNPVTLDVEDSPYNGATFNNQNDNVTYKTMSADSTPGNIVMSDDTYTIHRESNWGSTIRKYDKNNFFRIEIGEDNGQNIELYLTDFVSNLYPDSPYNSTSNALFNDAYDKDGNITQRAIVEYGYRVLSQDDNMNYTVPGETITRDTVVRDDENGKLTIDGLEGKYKLDEKNVSLIDSVTTGDNTVNRYQYYLGTFEPGDVIEVYMKDSTDAGLVYSSSSNIDGEYIPFDPSQPYLDDELSYLNEENTYYTAAQGGFNDGGWATIHIETDAMLDSYYFPDREEWKPFDNSSSTAAAQKAMPLSQLIPGTSKGMAVAFGLFGVTTGEAVPGGPLPGGLQIALIAGLFGLGFCYIRRRKAIVG